MLPTCFSKPFEISRFDSGRMMQAEIIFLKAQEVLPYRDSVNTAIEGRHLQVRNSGR